jgi:hypothetical protein
VFALKDDRGDHPGPNVVDVYHNETECKRIQPAVNLSDNFSRK